MNKQRKFLLKAKNSLQQKTAQVNHLIAPLFRIRKGSKISRLGRLFLEKTKQKIVAGVLLAAILPLGTLNGPMNSHQVEAVLTPEAMAASYLNEEQIVIPKTTQFPLKNFYISQGYHFYHQAVDLAAPYGTPIYPIANGQVILVSFNRYGLGNYLTIRHSASFYSVYAHLSSINVQKGDNVNQETIIGRVGSTGHSTGPHLHLETILEKQKINPLTILPKE